MRKGRRDGKPSVVAIRGTNMPDIVIQTRACHMAELEIETRPKHGAEIEPEMLTFNTRLKMSRTRKVKSAG